MSHHSRCSGRSFCRCSREYSLDRNRDRWVFRTSLRSRCLRRSSFPRNQECIQVRSRGQTAFRMSRRSRCSGRNFFQHSLEYKLGYTCKSRHRMSLKDRSY
jgi:hypothetical protein